MPSGLRSTTRSWSSLASSATAKRRLAPGDRVAVEQVSQPISDGAVLPILHLNGYKISNPTVLARIEHEDWSNFSGMRLDTSLCGGDEPAKMHQLMASTLETAIEGFGRSKAMPEIGITPLGHAGR